MAISNKEYAESLRLIADFYDSHDDIPLPIDYIGVNLYDYQNPVQDHKHQVASIAKALGDCEKYYSGYSFKLTKKFGDISLNFVWLRESICEKKVVGYKEVPGFFSPAHREEIVEWECKSILESEK